MSLSKRQRQRLRLIARGRSDEPLFVLEGRKAVLDGLETGHVAEVLHRHDAEPDLLAELGRAARAANVVPEAVSADDLRALGDTVTPQGIVALVRDPAVAPAEVLAHSGWVLWLDGLQDPGNVGALVRVAAGLGAAGLLLSHGSAHPMGSKALRASAGQALRVPFAIAPAADLADQISRDVLLLDTVGENLFDAPLPGAPGVLVIGSEGAGPGPEARARANGSWSIPLAEGVESLNAAVAGGIALAVANRRTQDGVLRV